MPCPLSRFYCISRGAEQVRGPCLDNMVISKTKPLRSISHGQREPCAAEPFSNLILTTVPCAHTGQGCHCRLEILTHQDCHLWCGCSQEWWHGQDGPTRLLTGTCHSTWLPAIVDTGVFQSVTMVRRLGTGGQWQSDLEVPSSVFQVRWKLVQVQGKGRVAVARHSSLVLLRW